MSAHTGTRSFDVIVVGLGGLGSATAWHLARSGRRVLGLEQFTFGHDRGASHDTSRILRHSYHRPDYVRLTRHAYADWSDLERESGERLVTRTGGVDLCPEGSAIPLDDYTKSLDAENIPYELLSAADVTERWPRISPPPDVTALYQERTSIVPAAQSVAAMLRLAGVCGATLMDRTPVLSVQQSAHGVEVITPHARYSAGQVVLCTDAWANTLLEPLGTTIPLTVLDQQVTYFEPDDPAGFAPEVFPVWIWLDDPSFFGFPCYGEATVKAGEDCGGPEVDPGNRTGTTDPAMLERLSAFMAERFPGSGRPVRSKRCLYTLTPDRDFVLGPVPGADRVLVGLGAAHAYKFAPTLGRMLAELAAVPALADTEPYTTFRLDRPALTDTGYAAHWMT
ncbi:N-methyl-L-tryptophan oxidase [Streptomyces baarnensis]|uniref:N-methyl-L-tryptophan oxidase n=1 Tax=Streptomyces TaxID=1883 RepID=UPI0029AB42A7|nr:N-methyl-L-tryptophan oxidase [Streptomyces sp. ME02-6979.5a]MDX3342665.1 N-methyl-L-tryptophan oxidase [Streptomyces sp. ME02-6979.5a]